VGRDRLLYPREIAKTEFPEARDDVLESRPEWRGLLRHGGRDADGETGPEVVNLGIWDCKSGRVLLAARKSGVWGCRISVFRKADIGEATRGRQESALCSH
jgi:hypothetical protein